MSLFEAPGWDGGASPIAVSSSSSRKSNKRKRTTGATTDEDVAAVDVTNVSTTSSPNLQKLMRKLRIEQERKNSAMERLKPSESVTKALKARKRGGISNVITSMDPPQAVTSSPISARMASPGTPSSAGQPPAKKPRVRREDSDVLPPSSAGDETEPSQFLEEIKRKKKNKKSRRQPSSENQPKPTTMETTSEPDSGDETVRLRAQPSPWTAPESDTTSDEYAGLTKMQREMKQRLSGGRFRMINELLYKSDSASAHDLMKKDPSTFEEYHVGFRNQVQAWPTNPVVHFTKAISSSHKATSTVIADLGCGDAALAKALTQQGFKVLSFDLVSDHEWVIEADICDKIPLPGKEEADGAQIVDICVCALSLMSTNWIRCVREARRVLKAKGELQIAEVASRFPDVKAFISLVCDVGFELVAKGEPSTHFTTFRFQKTPRSRVLTRKDWTTFEAKAKELLTPCEYKRR